MMIDTIKTFGSHGLRSVRLGPLVLMIVFTLLAGAGCSKRHSQPVFETASVKRGDLTQRITATGTLSAVVSVDVGSQISGIITTVNVDYNSPVKKGQVIALVDPASYQATVHQAAADLSGAKAALELAKLTADRKRMLVAEHAVTQVDVDKAVADLHQAEATVEIKQASLERAQVDLDHCTIAAPADGIVISRKIDIGQTVAASFNTPVLFTIANDLTKMHINASVSEADIGRTMNGQTAEFTVDAFPDEVFSGKVVQVRKAPATVENVVTYVTIIDFENAEQKLLPGMTADVSILVSQRKGVLKIPNAALRFIPPDGVKLEGVSEDAPSDESAASVVFARSQHLVYVPSGTPLEPKLKAVKVKVGIADGANSEILDGLREGDSVVTAAITKDSKSFGDGPPPR